MFLVIVWVYFPRLWVYITGIEDSVGMMILSFAFVVMEVKVMVKFVLDASLLMYPV